MSPSETVGRIGYLDDEERERQDAVHCQGSADVLRECAETCWNVASAR